jgi:astacin (peptidase family M12A)
MRKAFVLTAVILAGCGGGAPVTTTQPSTPSPVPAAPAPPAPTSWSVSGTVVNSTDFATPVAGATLTFGDAAPVVTDARGAFTILTTDSSTRPLTIAAPGFLLRETSLTGGDARAGVQFDLIGSDPKFPLIQYRDLVRNAWQGVNSSEPSHRWTTNPNLFIWTTWMDTGAAVSPAGLEYTIAEARRAIAMWTDGRYHLDQVEMSPANRPRQKGWINLQFNHAGNWSLLGEDPGWVQLGFDHTCGSLGIIHEFGHAMGYWHSRVSPSVMGGQVGTCTSFDLTLNEKIVARAMYARAPGNLEADKDGPPPGRPNYNIHPTGAPGGLFARPVPFQCDALIGR